MSYADGIRIQEQRKRLLTSLNLFYPTAVRVETVWRTVCDDPSYERVLYEKDIHYFVQKGWIELRPDPLKVARTINDRLVILTARGKEIAERTMTDEALGD